MRKEEEAEKWLKVKTKCDLPQKYMIPDTLAKVRKTQIMTNSDALMSDKRQNVAKVMAKVARPTFRYNSL